MSGLVTAANLALLISIEGLILLIIYMTSKAIAYP